MKDFWGNNTGMSLKSEEAEKKLKEYGPNEVIPSKSESAFLELKHALLDPMGLMLLILGFTYLFIGESQDALVLFISYIPVTAVDVFLELRAKKALRALKSNLQSTVKVIRDGVVKDILSRNLVPGDSILFEEGQKLPADGVVIEGEHLQMNESALTGESMPVDKSVGDQFFGGTVVMKGRGIGEILTTGRLTRFGQIAKLVDETEEESSPLKKKVNSLVKKVLIVAFLMSLFLLFFNFLKTENFSQSLLEAMAFGMATIPEEFPLVFMLYLSLGAYRLSKHGVLVKSLPSVEALGSVDVICTDKTGTLTHGIFKLEKIDSLTSVYSQEELWQFALMACEENPIDAMETAIYEEGNRYKENLNNWTLEFDYPFELKGKHMSHVWRNTLNERMILSMKGAVEGVLEHCLLDENLREKILEKVSFYGNQGKRLLALAGKNGKFSGDREGDEKGLDFLGLLIFSDPIRDSAREAITRCQKSGIEVKMLTGDHPITAHAVAEELGIIHSHDFLFTGEELLQLNSSEKEEAYLKGAIFSRVLPQQKFEMVDALKKSRKVVAMTGDGINDAPALKAADIGISMGKNATDVARSSAQMVLLENDFKGIIEAVFEGRRIFSNLRRSFSYLISFHIPIVFFALMGPLLGIGTLLHPIHIVLLELIVHPISAFSFENLGVSVGFEGREKSLLPKSTLVRALLSGFLLSGLGFLLSENIFHMESLEVRSSLVILTILMGNIFFVLVESWPEIKIRFFVTILFLILFSVFLYSMKNLSDLFHLTDLSTHQIIYSIVCGILASLPSFFLKNKKH